VGVEVALELIDQIKVWAGGVYLMPQFSKFDMAAEIIEAIP
jgi:homocysteine S-methyltransferase